MREPALLGEVWERARGKIMSPAVPSSWCASFLVRSRVTRISLDCAGQNSSLTMRSDSGYGLGNVRCLSPCSLNGLNVFSFSFAPVPHLSTAYNTDNQPALLHWTVCLLLLQQILAHQNFSRVCTPYLLRHFCVGRVLLYTHFWSLWTLIFRLGIFAHPNSFCGFLVHLPSKTRFSGTLSGTMWAMLAPKSPVFFWVFAVEEYQTAHHLAFTVWYVVASLIYGPACFSHSFTLHVLQKLPVSVPVVARVVALPSRQAHVGCPLHSNCNSHACQPVWCLLV